MVKKDDEVRLKAPHWHLGVDLGDRIGLVVSTESYILVEIYNYKNNPVKCFRSEVEKVSFYLDEDEEEDDDFRNLFGILKGP